nr:hypothetical protein [Candidatus Enterovibrio escacola]
MVNLLVGILAYSFQSKKLSIKMTRLDKQALMKIGGYVCLNIYPRWLQEQFAKKTSINKVPIF